MSTYIVMKILESTPSRYDNGINILTLGKLGKSYDRLTSHIKSGHKVLDLGCGTGALTLRAAQRGARVKGIDINPQMLEIAQKRVDEGAFSQNVKLCEIGIAELGSEEQRSYDVVMSGLCFSELTYDELNYALEETKRLLKLGGLLLIADEVKPKGFSRKIYNWLARAPLKVITYLLTQTTTNAVENLPEKVEQVGFQIETVRLNKMQDFMELVAMNHDRRTE